MSQLAQRAIAESKANQQQSNIGQAITVQIYGRMVTGKIIAVHPFSTVDVETPSGCYRVSGLKLNKEAT